ncbi:hypothetical protein IAT38_004172 [Cryptococcus sp. DSM 104549]
MSTAESITETTQKLQIRDSQSGLPRGAQFMDLPTEVVEVIVKCADKCHPLLLLCKQTCVPAGEKLYSRGPAITTEFPSRMRPVGFTPLEPFLPTQATLPQLLCGMDIKEPSPLSPFGRGLKMRFMRHLPGIHHHMLSQKEFNHLSGSVALQRRIPWDAKVVADLLRSLLVEGLEPFSALLDLRFTFHPNQLGDVHPYTRTPTNPFMVRRKDVITGLAALCKPDRFEWCLFAVSSRWDDPRKVTSPSCITPRFAGGHAPREAHHHVSDYEAGIEWLHYERPLPPVLHGTHNVVHIKTRERKKDDESDGGQRDLKQYCYYYLSCLLAAVKRSEQDGDDTSGCVSSTERELRARTRWCVKWFFDMVETETDPDERVQEVLDWTKSRIAHAQAAKSPSERMTVECTGVVRRRCA